MSGGQQKRNRMYRQMGRQQSMGAKNESEASGGSGERKIRQARGDDADEPVKSRGKSRD